MMGQGSIAYDMDVKAVAGDDGGKNGFAVYGDGGGADGYGVRQVGLGARAADRASEAFENELDGEGKNGREELA